MNTFEKLNAIQMDYVLFLIQSIKDVKYDYLQDTIFADDKNVNLCIRNMVVKRQDDVMRLETYLVRKEMEQELPFTNLLN